MFRKYLLVMLYTSFLSLCLSANAIPDSLVQFIKTNLPEYSILSQSEYDSYLSDYYGKEDKPFYYCSSDFNGDGYKDHTVLLQDTSKQIHIFAFLGQEKTFAKILIDKFDTHETGRHIIIRVEPKGVWESITDKKRVEYDGIAVHLINESLTWSYYFEDKTFKRFLYD